MNNNYHDIKHENRVMAKLLAEDYNLEYKKISNMLKNDVKSKIEREEALSDILVLLSDAQAEGIPPQSIYVDDFESFYSDLLRAFPNAITAEQKQNSHKFRTKLTITLCCAVVAFLIFFTLWQNDTIGVYQKGMAFFIEDSSYTINYEALDLIAETDIDLYNLNNNAGKIIYNDGKCKIEITMIKKEADGKYNAFFRTYGSYNRLGGSLISPTKQLMTEERNYKEDFVGKMQVVVNDKIYESYYSASSGINYKDGDEFGFYLFPLEYYKNDKLLLEDNIAKQNGIVHVRLYNLVRTTWSRK